MLYECVQHFVKQIGYSSWRLLRFTVAMLFGMATYRWWKGEVHYPLFWLVPEWVTYGVVFVFLYISITLIERSVSRLMRNS